MNLRRESRVDTLMIIADDESDAGTRTESIVSRVMNHVDSNLVYTNGERLRIIRPAKESQSSLDSIFTRPSGDAGN